MKEHGVKNTGFGATYLNFDLISMLISSVASNKSLSLSVLFHLADNRFSQSYHKDYNI